MIQNYMHMGLLRGRYCGKGKCPDGENFIASFNRYRQKNWESLVDSLMTVTSAELMLGPELSDLDSRLIEAIRDTCPHLFEDSFRGISAEQLLGAVNSAKGKYFEYVVTDRLNAGEQVGSVVLPDGYRAVLAETMNQPGWDMKIIGPDDAVAEYLQLKATSSLGYVREALRNYPDIKILATDEVAQSGVVLNSGISEVELQAKVREAIDVIDDTWFDDFLDYFSPLAPIGVMVGLAGYKLCVGQKSLEDFKDALLLRSGRILTANIAGAAVYAMGGGFLSIPAVFAGGLLYDRYWNQDAIATAYRKNTLMLYTLLLAQRSRSASGEFHGVL